MYVLFGASLTTADGRMAADGHAVRIILTIRLISKDLQKGIFRIAKGHLRRCGRCSSMARKVSFRNGGHAGKTFQSEKLVKQHDFYEKTTGVLKKAYNFAIRIRKFTVMRKYALVLLACLMSLLAAAQNDGPFKGTVRNKEYKIFITMNFYDKDIIADGNDVLGEMDGFIGSTQSNNKWFIIESRIKDRNTAEIDVVNEFGSEDFTAVLKTDGKGSYVLDKKDGSTMKFGVMGKWQKIPSDVTFTK